MKNKSLLWIFVAILVTSLVSCNFPLGQHNNSGVDIGTLVAIQVAQTQLAATMNGVSQTQPPAATAKPAEPTLTPTITLTPQPTFTSTLEGVWLTINENTNCRSGPATYYPLVTTLNQGTQIQAVARSPENDYYYVKNPNGSGYCWLWDKFSSLTGNINIIPVYTAVPTATPTLTPSPAPGLSVDYVSLTTCSGEFALRLKLKNTGSLIWQSVRVFIKDTTAATTFTHTSDQFKGFTGCSSDVVQQDLAPGEDGIVSNVAPGQFGYNPSGHNLKVTVTVYSKDGLAGDSYSVSINVTP